MHNVGMHTTFLRCAIQKTVRNSFTVCQWRSNPLATLVIARAGKFPGCGETLSPIASRDN